MYIGKRSRFRLGLLSFRCSLLLVLLPLERKAGNDKGKQSPSREQGSVEPQVAQIGADIHHLAHGGGQVANGQQLDKRLEKFRHVADGEEDAAQKQQREGHECGDRSGLFWVFGESGNDKPDGHKGQGAHNDKRKQQHPGAIHLRTEDEGRNQQHDDGLRSIKQQSCCNLCGNKGGCAQGGALHSAQNATLSPGGDLSGDAV